MASDTSIGNVQTIYLESYDSLQTKYETNISKGFVINRSATFADVNTAARALNALTTNYYEDTTLATNVSVNQEMINPEITISPSPATITVNNNNTDLTNPSFVGFTVLGADKLQAVNVSTDSQDIAKIRFLNVSVDSQHKTFIISAVAFDNVSTDNTFSAEITIIADNTAVKFPLTINRTVS